MNDLMQSVKSYFDDFKKGCNNLMAFEDLNKRIGAKDKMFILDIRKSEDSNKGHIEGAIHSEWVEV